MARFYRLQTKEFNDKIVIQIRIKQKIKVIDVKIVKFYIIGLFARDIWERIFRQVGVTMNIQV